MITQNMLVPGFKFKLNQLVAIYECDFDKHWIQLHGNSQFEIVKVFGNMSKFARCADQYDFEVIFEVDALCKCALPLTPIKIKLSELV